MKKTSKKTPSKAVLAHRIDALTAGESVTLPNLGVVKCIKAARASKDHRRKFSLTKSTVVENRRGWTFPELVKAMGLR